MKSALRLFIGLWLACGAALAGAEVAVPPLKARVTDLAALLQAGEVAALEQQLAALETRKGSQVAILIVPTTQPETIEQYALRVAENWKLGRKGVNDGALIVVAKDDRKLRIEVGYGLEGVIPDAIAKRIISDTITPLFKQKQFHAGLDAGVQQIVKLIDGEALPPPQSKPQQSTGDDDGGWWLLMAFVALGAARLVSSMLGKLKGAVLIGVAGGVAAWLFTQIIVIGLVAAFAAFLIALLAASGSSGWGGTSGGGWSSSSGGGSDSSFSGGGGDFGGGGASGDW